MTLLLNILWFVLGGVLSGLLWMLAGVLLAVTVVGLPWSLAAFRIGAFSFAPFGKRVVERRDLTGQPDLGTGPFGFLLNVIWFVLAGWWLALHHLVLAIAGFVSIIGIPFGLQHIKLAVISFAPVGRTVVKN